MTPSKSIPQKRNHDSNEIYPYLHEGTLVSKKTHNDMTFGKEVKMNIVVDKSLYSLSS